MTLQLNLIAGKSLLVGEGDNLTVITGLITNSNSMELSISAPQHIKIHREEVRAAVGTNCHKSVSGHTGENEHRNNVKHIKDAIALAKEKDEEIAPRVLKQMLLIIPEFKALPTRTIDSLCVALVT